MVSKGTKSLVSSLGTLEQSEKVERASAGTRCGETSDVHHHDGADVFLASFVVVDGGDNDAVSFIQLVQHLPGICKFTPHAWEAMQ